MSDGVLRFTECDNMYANYKCASNSINNKFS